MKYNTGTEEEKIIVCVKYEDLQPDLKYLFVQRWCVECKCLLGVHRDTIHSNEIKKKAMDYYCLECIVKKTLDATGESVSFGGYMQGGERIEIENPIDLKDLWKEQR